MRISDWSSDVCSSDLTDWKTGQVYDDKQEEYIEQLELYALAALLIHPHVDEVRPRLVYVDQGVVFPDPDEPLSFKRKDVDALKKLWGKRTKPMLNDRSEEHTSELQSLMRISYAVFCLKKKKKK